MVLLPLSRQGVCATYEPVASDGKEVVSLMPLFAMIVVLLTQDHAMVKATGKDFYSFPRARMGTQMLATSEPITVSKLPMFVTEDLLVGSGTVIVSTLVLAKDLG
jgi:hypothetical protein